MTPQCNNELTGQNFGLKKESEIFIPNRPIKSRGSRL